MAAAAILASVIPEALKMAVDVGKTGIDANINGTKEWFAQNERVLQIYEKELERDDLSEESRQMIYGKMFDHMDLAYSKESEAKDNIHDTVWKVLDILSLGGTYLGRKYVAPVLTKTSSGGKVLTDSQAS